MNINKALKIIAKRNGVSIAEVRREIQEALDEGMRNPDPKIQAYWNSIPRRSKKPTVEEVFSFIGIVTANSKNENGNTVHKLLEVDFVCNIGSKRYYVQSAFSVPDNEKMKQEANSLLRIDDSFKKIIVVKDTPAPWYTEDGILVIGVYDFLLNVDSLEV